jgi:hypothetical protein
LTANCIPHYLIASFIFECTKFEFLIAVSFVFEKHFIISGTHPAVSRGNWQTENGLKKANFKASERKLANESMNEIFPLAFHSSTDD